MREEGGVKGGQAIAVQIQRFQKGEACEEVRVEGGQAIAVQTQRLQEGEACEESGIQYR